MYLFGVITFEFSFELTNSCKARTDKACSKTKIQAGKSGVTFLIN